MSRDQVRQLAVIVVILLLGAGVYVGSTTGWNAYASRQAERQAHSGEPPAFPDAVQDAPTTVPRTSERGPVGPVSLVYGGQRVEYGLSGSTDDPWIAFGGVSGDYRALDVPHRPPADGSAMVIAPAGDLIAWGWSGGIVLYDPIEDTARELTDGLGDAPVAVGFSPSGDRLAVFDGQLKVLDVRGGEPVAAVTVPAESGRQAVWTTDGESLTFVRGGQLVWMDAATGDLRAVPTRMTPDETLAWSPEGGQLAAMRKTEGVKQVDVWRVSPSGAQQLEVTLAPDRMSLQRLLGFTDESSVTVVSLSIDSGALETIYRVSFDQVATPMSQLPAEGGSNWRSSASLAVAAQPLAESARTFEKPRTPWSDASKLVASLVLTVFLLGLWLTRRLPQRRRLRRQRKAQQDGADRSEHQHV